MFEWFGDDSGEWNRRALEAAGAHAMGRRSYEIMRPHWAASEGPIATAMNEKPKAVFSHTLQKAEGGPAEIFAGDLAAAIAELKARDDEGTVLVQRLCSDSARQAWLTASSPRLGAVLTG